MTAAPNQRIFIICGLCFIISKHFPLCVLISIRSILMDNQALGQLNPCIVQHAGSWFRRLAGPFFTLRAYPGDRSLYLV
ncbi:hypothetical protein AL525_018500 [Citrobacter amalonaticus]|nr:hypothetical protein AL525_018500 [Citrobacter amalonaticus]